MVIENLVRTLGDINPSGNLNPQDSRKKQQGGQTFSVLFFGSNYLTYYLICQICEIKLQFEHFAFGLCEATQTPITLVIKIHNTKLEESDG